MPSISQLLASGASESAVYGIAVDTDEVMPPEGIREAGILVSFEDGDISNDVLDVAISWSLAGIDVTLEVEAETEIPDLKRLVSTVAAVNMSLSLLPPKEDSQEAFEAWTRRVEEATLLYCEQPNMARHLLPVTSYLGYVFIEICSPDTAKDFVPDDPYILSAFHGRMPVERADTLKARIRAAFSSYHGGEDRFLDFARNLLATIYRRLKEDVAEEARTRAAGGQDGQRGPDGVSGDISTAVPAQHPG